MFILASQVNLKGDNSWRVYDCFTRLFSGKILVLGQFCLHSCGLKWLSQLFVFSHFSYGKKKKFQLVASTEITTLGFHFLLFPAFFATSLSTPVGFRGIFSPKNSLLRNFQTFLEVNFQLKKRKASLQFSKVNKWVFPLKYCSQQVQIIFFLTWKKSITSASNGA